MEDSLQKYFFSLVLKMSSSFSSSSVSKVILYERDIWRADNGTPETLCVFGICCCYSPDSFCLVLLYW